MRRYARAQLACCDVDGPDSIFRFIISLPGTKLELAARGKRELNAFRNHRYTAAGESLYFYRGGNVLLLTLPLQNKPTCKHSTLPTAGRGSQHPCPVPAIRR